ncbi:protein kinase domain-containing protein [Planobispora rosea]|uniref:protein kinase domain-containing protein n=1 Tax=Planobispora rosea TaxID=35762 RepID=UPI00083B867E|nr:protein kinase [Planobispora rosea]
MSDSQELIADRYRLLEHIGHGGMGTVWRARDEVLGRHVAVKEVIPSPDLTAPEREVFTVRTLREARAAGRIGHPGVATVYDVIEERGRPWIVMQLVDSRTLGAAIRDDGPLPPYEVARIGLDVLGALVAAHRVGVLHRDVKPDNVLLATDGRAVLTDFGIAVLEGDSSVTRTGAIIGTPAFIAPERAAGGPAEFASDLWSLGVTLYMAVEGHSPFQRAHPLATLAAVMHDAPAPLRRAGALGPVIYGLLHKDPARRMSAQEVQRHLMAIVSGIAPEPTMPSVPVVPPAEPGSERPSAEPADGTPAVPPVVPSAAAPAAPPPAAPGLPGGAVPRPGRRRSLIAATTATTVAVALTAGAAAWITSKDTAVEPRRAPASVSVPSTGASPSEGPVESNSAEDAGGPSAETGGGLPSSPPASDGRGERTREPSGEPSEKPSDKPSEKPSDKPSEKPSEKPSPDETDDDGSGGGSGDDEGQDPGRNEDSPGQVDPRSEVNVSDSDGLGRESGKETKTGTKAKDDKRKDDKRKDDKGGKAKGGKVEGSA